MDVAAADPGCVSVYRMYAKLLRAHWLHARVMRTGRDGGCEPTG